MVAPIQMKPKDIAAVRKELLAAQGFICPLCGNSMRGMSTAMLAIDHNHATGYVRAVLHKGCNRMEGKIKTAALSDGKSPDYISTIRRLIAFWDKHKFPQTNYIHPSHKTPNQKRTAPKRKAPVRRRK